MAERGNDKGLRDFGCEYCWPTAAEAAYEASSGLGYRQDLIDESHFQVSILTCPRCTQSFIAVFTEIIDWQGGDDPQHWMLMPITGMEVFDLTQEGGSLIENRLNALGRARRSLQLDRPEAGVKRIYWGGGISVGKHD